MAVSLSAPFYFTLEDPDYSVKGARDPLGFQVVWQEQARHLIPYLSTVSSNLQDFQVLSLAYFLFPQEDEQSSAFVKFFIRWEQLTAYARWEMGERQFGGRRRVGKIMSEDVNYVSISNSSKDEILSSQRSYGIWAKYNRPFREIGFTKHKQFQSIYSQKFSFHPNRSELQKLITTVLDKQGGVKVAREQLKLLFPLLKLTKQEKQFYNSAILQLPHPDAPQNLLYHFLQSCKTIPEINKNFYSFLHSFKSSLFVTRDVGLAGILTDIEETEKILCPLNHIFRYLQSRPSWSRVEIEKDDFIKQCKHKAQYRFLRTTTEAFTKNALSATLAKTNWELAEDLVKRNKEVTAQRGGAAWVSISGDVLEVHHKQGAMAEHEFNCEADADNYYFIDTYVSLYKQIMGEGK